MFAWLCSFVCVRMEVSVCVFPVEWVRGYVFVRMSSFGGLHVDMFVCMRSCERARVYAFM